MAEDGTVEQQEQGTSEGQGGSHEQEDASTMGRLKSRVRGLVGKDSGEGDGDSEQENSGDDETSAEEDSSTESESSSEESGSSEDEDSDDSDDSKTSVSTDDVELDTVAEDEDTARAQIDKMEEDGPPEDLAEWPTGKAMYLSFGGAEGEEGYEEGPAQQMGPSSLRHHADGSVEVKGEKVDNPEDYKGEKSVGDEAEEIGMDKGAKSEDEEGEDSEGSESSEGSDDSEAQSESSDGADAQSESSDGAESESSPSSEDEGDSSSEESAEQGETAEQS